MTPFSNRPANGGAKLLQDRVVIQAIIISCLYFSNYFKVLTTHIVFDCMAFLAARNFLNFKLALKRLEEVSVFVPGGVQLLRRWLVALKEIERPQESANTEHLDMSNVSNESPAKPTVVGV